MNDQQTTLAGFVIMPAEPTPSMIAAAKGALRAHLGAMSMRERRARYGAPTINGSRVPPAEKHAIRYRAMVAAYEQERAGSPQSEAAPPSAVGGEGQSQRAVGPDGQHAQPEDEALIIPCLGRDGQWHEVTLLVQREGETLAAFMAREVGVQEAASHG
jgi:hypothetical protein